MAAPARAVAWLRNDLRLRDNEIFWYPELLRAEELLVVYCVDPRHYEQSGWGDHRRTGPHRARLLAGALEELGRSLRAAGSALLVLRGRPEELVPPLLQEGHLLAFQREDAHEERAVEAELLGRLGAGVAVRSHLGQTLLHRDDLGWDPETALPLPFGKFYHETCGSVQPRAELPAPRGGQLPRPPADLSHERAVAATVDQLAAHMSFPPEAPEPHPAAAFSWKGGEAAALAQLGAWCQEKGLGQYQMTRNQLHGEVSGSRLSPWLALGCLSPRTVYWRATEFERDVARARRGAGKDGRGFEHVRKFIFQLCWRDYFHFYVARFGRRIFFLTGPARRERPWKTDEEAARRWKEGTTGVPLVDALMRELRQTGWMSNRGRYIVASYLVFYLNLDWRIGADWFESLLMDHDVCSNYGEWASMANVAVDLGDKYPLGLKGRGPTSGRLPGAHGGGGDPWARGVSEGDAVFDPWEQAEHYDRQESYVRRWLPELARVPVGSARRAHELGHYPAPLAAAPAALAKRRVGEVAPAVAAPARQEPPAAAQSPGAAAKWARRQRGQGHWRPLAGLERAGPGACGAAAGPGARRWKPKDGR